jgi:hypothetical protein
VDPQIERLRDLYHDPGASGTDVTVDRLFDLYRSGEAAPTAGATSSPAAAVRTRLGGLARSVRDAAARRRSR